MTEYDEQRALFDWVEWRSNQDPRLDLLYAVPNGQYRPGQRLEPGVRAGVPDLCLPVACGEYHGLYIELKHGENTTTAEQEQWLERLSAQGYRAVVAYEFDGAVEEIEAYLALDKCIGK